jgi:hypothetical protein
MAGTLVTTTNTFSSPGPNGAQFSGSNVIPGNAEFDFYQVVPPASSAVQYGWAFPHATLDSFWVQAIGGAATIVFLNSSSTESTMVLAAGQIVKWDSLDNTANSTQYPAPFAADITSVKVTTTPGATIAGRAVCTV